MNHCVLANKYIISFKEIIDRLVCHNILKHKVILYVLAQSIKYGLLNGSSTLIPDITLDYFYKFSWCKMWEVFLVNIYFLTFLQYKCITLMVSLLRTQAFCGLNNKKRGSWAFEVVWYCAVYIFEWREEKFFYSWICVGRRFLNACIMWACQLFPNTRIPYKHDWWVDKLCRLHATQNEIIHLKQLMPYWYCIYDDNHNCVDLPKYPIVCLNNAPPLCFNGFPV